MQRDKNCAVESEQTFSPEAERRERSTGSGFGAEKGTTPGLALPGNVIHTHTSQQSGHSAAFPPELPEFFLKAFSDPGDLWLDPFSGSGSTACAGERCGRITASVDIDPLAVSVAIQRLSEMGLEVRRDEEGG